MIEQEETTKKESKKKKLKKKESTPKEHEPLAAPEAEPEHKEPEAPKAEPKQPHHGLKIGDHCLTHEEMVFVESKAKTHCQAKTPWIPYKKLTQEKLDALLSDHTFMVKLKALKFKAPKK
jgi:hypothetical protein